MQYNNYTSMEYTMYMNVTICVLLLKECWHMEYYVYCIHLNQYSEYSINSKQVICGLQTVLVFSHIPPSQGVLLNSIRSYPLLDFLYCSIRLRCLNHPQTVPLRMYGDLSHGGDQSALKMLHHLSLDRYEY